MPRYKLTIEYDGTDYFGWQIQPDARTVEGDIEKAITKILQKGVDLVGQGRTDAGVHAKAQVAHIDLDDGIIPENFILSINRLTGNDVFIHSIEEVAGDFHSRFDASSRAYQYRLLKAPSPIHDRFAYTLPRTCDIEKMKAAAEVLIGEFDFSELSKKNDDLLTTICAISTSAFEEDEHFLVYNIRANRFLRNMVRRIVGAMIMIGEGKMTESELKGLLNQSETVSVKTAPAKGLVLTNVAY